jgi:hypothetical protein
MLFEIYVERNASIFKTFSRWIDNLQSVTGKAAESCANNTTGKRAE